MAVGNRFDPGPRPAPRRELGRHVGQSRVCFVTDVAGRAWRLVTKVGALRRHGVAGSAGRAVAVTADAGSAGRAVATLRTVTARAVCGIVDVVGGVAGSGGAG